MKHFYFFTNRVMKSFRGLALAAFVLLGTANAFAQYSGTGTFTKITSLADLTDGYYVIVNSGDGYAMNNSTTQVSGCLGYTSVTPSGGTISNPTTGIVWKISTSGTDKTIYNEATSKYVSYTGSSNNVQVTDAASTNNQKWTFTYASNVFTAKNVALNTRMLQYNNSTPRFACYTSAQQKLLLYKMSAPSCTTPTVSWSIEPANGTAGGSGMTATVTTNYPAGLVFSSSNTSAATINSSTGAIAYVGEGTTTITATVTGDGTTYCTGPATVTKEITVAAACTITPTVSFAQAGPISKLTTDPSFTNAATVSAGSGAITYTSSNTAAATVNPTSGAVMLVGAGNTTITATAAANGDYCEASASYTLEVSAPTYTLTWNNNGSISTTTVVQGQSIGTLPTNPTSPASCSSKAFYGWSKTNIGMTPATDAPTIISATETPTQNETYYAVFADGGLESWELVTNASTLAAGNEVIIAASSSNYAISTTQNTNNRSQAAITKSGSTLEAPATDVQQCTLEAGTIASTFSFNVGTGYLYAASSSSNYLRTETTKSANSSWTITVTEGVATITAQGSYSRNVMQYNSGSSLFSCYASASMQSLALYKKTGGATNFVTLCEACTSVATELSISADATSKNLDADGQAVFTLTATKGSNQSDVVWALTSNPESGASLSGTALTATKAGTYVVSATQVKDGTGYCAQNKEMTITVLATPVVTIVDTTPLTFTADCGTESASQTITVNGWNLTTANVTVTVGDNFKVSTDGTTFGSSVTLTKTDGKINNQTVYVRATPATAAEVNYTGTITVSGGGAETNATLDVSVTGACNKIDITFHDNAGLAADAISQIYPGTAIGTLPAAPTVPAEYCAVFDGWSTTPLAVGDSLTSYTKVTTATVFSATTTVYAVYKKAKGEAGTISYGWEDSDDATPWTINSGITTTTTASEVHTGSKAGTFSSNLGNVIKYNNKVMPASISFWLYKKTTNNNYNIDVETSTDGNSWTSAISYPMSDWSGETYAQKTFSAFINTDPVYVRLFYNGTTAVRVIDDVVLEFGSSIFTTEAPCGPSVSATLNVTKVTGHKAQYVEVADTLRVNAVRMDGTYNNVKIKVLDNTNFKVKEAGNGGAGGAEQTYTGMAGTDASKKIIVTYTPTTANTTETAQIEVSLYKSVYAESNIISKCTLNVTARALPDTFVVAAKYGEQWVALPNNYGTTMETPKAAYPITVDNATDPTKATLAPTSAFYKAGARNPVNTASQGMRLQRYADGYSLDASDNGTNLALKNIASSEGVTWFLRSDDLKDYQIARNGAEDGRYLTLSGDKIGHYKQPTLVRILPIEVECTRFNSLQNLAEVTKNSSSVELSWDAVDGATAYQYSLDNSTWHDAGTGTSYTVTGLTAGTTVTIYVRVKVASGENCSEVSSITVTIPNCDNAPTVTVTSMTIPENNCGTLKIAYSGLTITTESATCPFTNFGIVYDTVADFSKNPQYLEMGTTTLRAAADTTITVTKAGMYYFGMYAVNEVGRGKTVSQISADVEGLSNLAILLKDNNQTAAMINGKASTRVTYMSESDGAVTWTVKNPSGTEIPNDIAESGYFTGTSMGIYTVSVAQVAAGGYCAATASTYIEVRNPQYFGYITNCAITNNNNIEVIEQDVDSMRVVVDDANVVQIEIVRENSGGGEGGGSQANDLFFSKYFEATGNLKLVGIFNGTGADVDITNVKIGVGAADKSGNTAYSTGASLMNFTNTSTQCIHLGSLGIPNNKILAGQEIIIYTFGGAESNNTSETGTVRLDTCINDELISNTEDHLKMEERDNWYRVESSGAAPIVTGAGICQWSGRQALALWRLSATDTTMLDIFGSYHIDATYGAYAGDSIRASAAFGHEGDAEGWVSPAGTNYLTGATEVIGTNRALLIRKNTVVDGQNAMQLNLDHDFVTLGGPNGEWMGQSVGGGSGSTWLPNSKTCQAFSSVAGFDYADYFQRYEPVTEKITLDGTPNPDGTFTITTDDFAGTSFEGTTFEDLHCNTLKINGYNGDNLVTSLTYKVPIIVKTTMNTDNDSVFNIDKQGKVICPDCDVVIRDAATLTVVPKGYNTLRDVYVYADARLSVPASKTYQMRKLYIQSENNKVGYALVEGTLAANTGIGHTKRIDAQAWYDFTLPYNCKMTDIMRTNGKSLGTYGTDWVIKYYDGAKRAESGTPNGAAPTNWEAVAATGTLQAGVGYVLGLGGWHNDKPAYKVRINLPNVEGQIYTETATSDRQKTVVGHTGTAAQRLPCHQGWNYIGNPFVSRFNRANETPDPWTTDLLLNGYYTDGLTGQTYDPLPDIYVAVQQGENGTTDWVQTTASDALLSPFRAFFVQAVGDGTVDFRKDARDLPAAVMARSVAHDEVVSSFRLTLTGAKTGSNYTELKLHNDYSMAYEVGHDMVRMMNYKVAPEPFILDNQGYYLIYGAVDRTTAEQSVIPLGYYASASDTYTFSLNRQQALDDYEAVYLKDNEQNLTKDLLAGNYTFTSGRARNTSRFTITLQKRQNVVTEVVEVEGDVPSIYAKDDVLIIENLPEGATTRIIDAVGRVLYMTNEHNGTVHFRTPARGAYVIQVMTPEQTYAIKTIL